MFTQQGLKRLREQAGFALFVNEVAFMMRRNNPEIQDEEIQRVSVAEVRWVYIPPTIPTMPFQISLRLSYALNSFTTANPTSILLCLMEETGLTFQADFNHTPLLKRVRAFIVKY